MQFTDMTFLLVFLPAVLILYYIFSFIDRYMLKCRGIGQSVILLAGNLLFYAVGAPDYFAGLCLITLCNVVIGMLLSSETWKDSKFRRPLLLAGIFGNVMNLAVFKYAPNLLLPLGLSFYTFKAISLLVDSYFRKIKIASVVEVTNYLIFFGQIQMGPIARYDEFTENEGKTGLALFSDGIQRFMIGFAKKMLLANVVMKICNEALAEWNLTMGMAWLGVIAFWLQLYYDFSGYSDMAIGMSEMFGIRCKENFNYPFATASISEFWRRWHISLGSWFRDYVYIPLGGSRVSTWKNYRNLFAVWILTGMWHGNTWGFVFWGMAFFVLISFERWSGLPGRLQGKLSRGIYRVFSLLMILFTWSVFYYGDLRKGLHVVKIMLLPVRHTSDHLSRAAFLIQDYKVFLFFAVIFAFPIVPFLQAKCEGRIAGKVIYNIISGIFILAAFILAVAVGVGGASNPFLYMGF